MDTKLVKVLTNQWESPILKAIWPFDPVKGVTSRDNLKNLCFYYQQIFGQ